MMLRIAIGLLVFVALLIAARGFGWCYRRWIDRGLARQARGRLVLTYDDGPNAPATPLLADLLDKHGVTATFYLLGMRAERHPELCQMLLERGHDLGTHSYAHKHAWKVNAFSAIADYRAGVRTLAQWTTSAASFRPPHGKVTFFTWLALKLMGVRIVGWTLDSGDTAAQLPRADVILDRFVASGGGVVLLHCHHATQERIDYILSLTDRLIAEANQRGWPISTIRELSS